MCVLVCRVADDLLVAANRDEAYARPFSAPRRWVADTPFWAPRDEEEGGTWIGVNTAGLLAAITNRSREKTHEGRASRGHLVTGLLAQPDPEAARAWLESELVGAARNPCQLFVAQGARAWVCAVGDDGPVWTDLTPGIHVLSNFHDIDEIDFGLDTSAGWDEIAPIMADTRKNLPRDLAVCKYAGWRGTVASALIEPGKRFLFAGGPPDKHNYEAVDGYPG